MEHSPESLIGGRYRLQERLGEGGFGAVYSALDTQLKREVALKLLNPESAARGEEQARKLRERFRREAIATAAIDHPNVVTVFDVGIANEGDVYIVMERLRGHSLDEELAAPPHRMESERALPHFVRCLEALGLGHDAGVVHKDLKPSNLFLVNPGMASESMRIIDFGVARVLHEQKLTSTGRIVGTPRYLAPEYIREHEVSPALDVYQMALILVETLTGRSVVPRGLDLIACCEIHLSGDLRIPAPLQSGDFGTVIRRATALDPADRFEDAAEFSRALGAIDPAQVKHATQSDERETPRLGVASVGRDSSDAVTVERDPPPPTATEEDVLAGHPSNVQSLTPVETARESDPNADRPDATSSPQRTANARTERQEDDPSTGTMVVGQPITHRMIYGLLALALAVAAATAFTIMSLSESDAPGDENVDGAAAAVKPRATEPPAAPSEPTAVKEEPPESEPSNPVPADGDTPAEVALEDEPEDAPTPRVRAPVRKESERSDDTAEPEPRQPQDGESRAARADNDEATDDPVEPASDDPQVDEESDEMLILE